MNNQGNVSYAPFLFACLLVIAGSIVFWPGTSGGFWFDDYSTLKLLNDHGEIDTLEKAQYFVFSGVASALGRPLSLLTFLFDGRTWPTETFPFKVTNIIIHCLNGVLLYAVIAQLLRLMGIAKSQYWRIAFLGALIWTIHPIQVSTVSYVVQRMTELSALFILLAIGSYLHGRRILDTRPGPAYYWMTLGPAGLGLLSLLSKENAVLIPLLILIIEATLLIKRPRPSHWRYWALPVLGLPVAILLSYLIYTAITQSGYAIRDFTLEQRLLTEPRIIFDYLAYLVLPLHTPTLYYDDYRISTGLFSPLSTVFAIAALLGALFVAIGYRKRLPILSFAILWYLGAHLLESTVVALELYFEHRNYIPLLGPALAAGWYLNQWLSRTPRIAVPGTAALVLVLASVSLIHSSIWGNDLELAQEWASENPDSVRGATALINELLKNERYREALDLARETVKQHPDHLGAQLTAINIGCLNNRLEEAEYRAILEDARTKTFDTETFPALMGLHSLVDTEACQQISWVGLLKILDGLLENPSSAHRAWAMENMYRMKSHVAKELKLFDATVEALDDAFAIEPKISTLLRNASLNASFGRVEIAEKYLANAYILDDQRGRFTPSSRTEIDELRDYIEDVKRRRSAEFPAEHNDS